MWNKIDNLASLESFMMKFDCFHDSCIKELRYISGAFVDKNLNMSPINTMRVLKIIFQRQYKNPMAIEMEFLGVSFLKLTPIDESYTCEIEGASIFMTDNEIFWYDSEVDSKPDNTYEGTWLCAQSARWRIADEYIGDKEIY